MKHQNALQELIDENLPLLSIKIEQRELWIENGVIEAGSNEQTELGLNWLDTVYDLVLAVDDLENVNSSLLMLLVHRFVSDLGDNKMGPLDFTVSPNDETTLDVEFRVRVRESLHLVPVENSPIEIRGQKMGFGDSEFTVAESLGSIDVNR